MSSVSPYWIVNDIRSDDDDDYGHTHEHILLMGKGLRLQFTIYSYGGEPDDGPAVLVLGDSIDSDRLLDEYATVQEAQDAVAEWMIDEMLDWSVALYGRDTVRGLLSLVGGLLVDEARVSSHLPAMASVEGIGKSLSKLAAELEVKEQS